MTTQKKILLVDDEEDIRLILKYNLEKEGYAVNTANNGKEALEKAIKYIPDLILLDVMMPEMDGMEACAEMRKISELNKTIICFLTARAEDYSQLAGYENGADDYVTKPIKPKVLLSKIKALLRRNDRSKIPNESKNPSGFEILKDQYSVKINTEIIPLPKKEFELLDLLYSNMNKILDRKTILDTVWGHDIIVGDRTIDVHIRKLREKIGTNYIKTIKGVGYQFVEC